MKFTGRDDWPLNCVGSLWGLPVRGVSPHRQARCALQCIQMQIGPAGVFHERIVRQIYYAASDMWGTPWQSVFPAPVFHIAALQINRNSTMVQKSLPSFRCHIVPCAGFA